MANINDFVRNMRIISTRKLEKYEKEFLRLSLNFKAAIEYKIVWLLFPILNSYRI